MDKKRMLPLAIILIMASAGLATAATLWVVSLTATVTLAPSQYTTLIFSDPDTCLVPITSINFGTAMASYEGPAATAWFTVTLQLQTSLPPLTRIYIHPSLTGTLPAGATLERERQKFDLTWISEPVATQGFFNTMVPGSPLVNGLQVQRWRYRITFAQGAVTGVFNNFGFSYLVDDVNTP